MAVIAKKLMAPLSLELLLLLVLSLGSSKAFAYKMAIYTDEPDQTKAKEVVNLFRSTYPFSQYELEIEIKSVAAAKLNCGSRHGIARLVGCDTEVISRDAASRGIDQVLVVKNSADYGGSGGGVPVMTSSSPTSMMLHEYLHTLGLCDEYQYAASEAGLYCSDGGGNMAIFAPNPQGYQSDAAARSEHMGDIPWGEFIKSETLITNNSETKLGTGAVNRSLYATPNTTNSPSSTSSAIGLYQGQTCKNANPPKSTWQPGREASIMEFLSAGLGAGNEAMVAKILESKGLRKKEQLPESASSEVFSSQSRKAKDNAESDGLSRDGSTNVFNLAK